MSELKIKEVEATVLKLEPGDVLAVKVRLTQEQDAEESLQSLREHMNKMFPNNRVMLFSLDTGNEIQFDVIKGESV